jgi:hypothetical protein
MTSRMASYDVYRRASLLISAVSEIWTFTSCHEQWFVKNLDLIRVVLWTRLRVGFNAYVDPLYDFQVIYRALTRQPTTGWYVTIA